MKRKILVVFFQLILLICYSQDAYNEESINNNFEKFIKDSSRYDRKLFVDTIEEGVVDSLIFYFEEKDVKYIKYHRYVGGLTSVDDNFFDELFFVGENLGFYKNYSIFLYYDKGNSPESSASASTYKVYFKENNQCMKYFSPKSIEGTRGDIYSKVNTIRLDEKDCMYCLFSIKKLSRYLKRLE